MPRSPIFLFAILVVIAVSFVAVAGMMNAKQPVDPSGSVGIYNNTSQPANYTAGMLTTINTRAPMWVMPAIWVAVAILVISTAFLLAKRR